MATGTQYLGIGVALGCLTTLISIAFVLRVVRRRVRISLSTHKELFYREQIFPPPRMSSSWYYIELPSRLHCLDTRTFEGNMLGCLHISPVVAKYLGLDEELEAVHDVAESTFDEAKLEALAGPPPDWANWSGGLAKARTRVDTARRFLAQYLLARMDPAGNPDDTLLPPDMLRCYQDLTTTNNTLHRLHDKAYQSVWRETCYLMVAQRYGLNPLEAIGDMPFIDGDPREDKVKQVVATLRDALKLDVIVRQELQPNLDFSLRYMVGRAANTAMALFGQPGEWHVKWETDLPGHLWFPKVVITRLGKPMLFIPGEVEFRWADKDERGWVHEDCALHWDDSCGSRKAIVCWQD
ncbi:hypothetical protein EDB81DRAFT_752301 [Dactylonectria macrodidyma]|uniref:Uncharacterized protein n=1 Tax=Dactylonectria macrodidyma TaxID=307937 RepID=A0A9P9FVZ5_9HYPO|nr:hypothetical protein EDB81DRAFT_752301 [Dactylonectria macrodidyma]